MIKLRFLPLVLLTVALPSPATPLTGSEPLIEAGDASVRVVDMEALLTKANGASIRKLFSIPGRVESVAERIYVKRLLAQEARQLQLDQSPVQQAMLRQREEDYLSGLRLKALDVEPVPDMSAAAEAEYQAHPGKYSDPEQVQVSHIVILTGDRFKQRRSKEEARKLIGEIRERALKGEDFTALADEYSEDPSVKRNHGDLGLFARGSKVKPFEEVAFAMQEPGEISAVVETTYGFHIIQFKQRKPGKLHPFEQVRDQIINKLQADYRQTRREEYLAKLKLSAGPMIEDAVLEAYVQQKRKQLGIGKENQQPEQAPSKPQAAPEK